MALPQKNRLRAKKDFDNLFKNGRTVKGHFLLVKTIKSGAPARVGLIVPSKIVKKAVDRNRIKRTLSGIVYGMLSTINGDIVVLLLKAPSDKEVLVKELQTLISKLK